MAARIATRIRRAILRLTDVRTKRFWILLVLFGPVGYVLSAGPMGWLMYNGYIGHDSPFWQVYYPIAWLEPYCEPLARFMAWYVGVWVPELNAPGY